MRAVDVPSRHRPGIDARVKDSGPRSGERGFCALKSLLWFAIMGTFIYVCIEAGPVFVAEYQFQDTMQEMARFASVNRQTPDDLRASLLKEAFKEDGIPLRPADIRITANSGNVKIEAAYTVTVDLHFYQWVLTFHPSATNNALF